jgi:hypothetical protein
MSRAARRELISFAAMRGSQLCDGRKADIREQGFDVE